MKEGAPKNTNWIFWGFISVIIVLVSILIARSPFIKLNLNNQFNANYITFPEAIPFEGILKPNNLLQSAKYIGHKRLVGAESIVFDKEGNIYTGLANGQIVKIDKNDQNNIEVISYMGEINDQKICNSDHVVAKCGRPLGLRIDREKNILYVADSLLINLIEQGEKTLILSSKDTRFGADKLKFLNDLAIDDNIIYFLDTSNIRGVEGALEEHAEARANGRLFKYDTSTGLVETLADNLFFPNGLELTPDKEALLINENTAARILKYFLSGPNKGKIETFIDLPGFSDNIRLTEHNTLLVPFAIARDNKSLLEVLGKLPFLRNLFSYFINFREIFKIVPKYGLIVEYDLNGKPLKSWHDPTGKVIESSSQAELHDNKLYLGSFYIDYMAVVDY